MAHAPVLHPLAVTCQQSSTAGAVSGLVILLAIAGAIVGLAIANGRARQRLASANAEIAFLRPENARLQQWVAGLTGSAVSPGPTGGTPPGYGGGPAAYSVPPQWYADPSGRHELRYWDGAGWSDRVSDHGTTSTDPAV
jgi:hypothetical protein